MRRAICAPVVLALAAALPAGGAELELGGPLTIGQAEELLEHLADAVAFPNLSPAEPLGLLGFEITVASGGPRTDDGDGWWRNAIGGGSAVGVLPAHRLIARKGLPGRIDLGAQVGEVLGERFWGAELRWAFFEGGMLTPAVGLRASFTRLDAAGEGIDADLDVLEGQLTVSKGFGPLTPYGALGYRRADGEARWVAEGTVPVAAGLEDDHMTLTGGVRFTVFPFRLMAEVRQARKLGVFVGIGVSL
jgi:hypothetical protein